MKAAIFHHVHAYIHHYKKSNQYKKCWSNCGQCKKQKSSKNDIYHAWYDFYGKIMHIHDIGTLKNAYLCLYIAKSHDSQSYTLLRERSTWKNMVNMKTRAQTFKKHPTNTWRGRKDGPLPQRGPIGGLLKLCTPRPTRPKVAWLG